MKQKYLSQDKIKRSTDEIHSPVQSESKWQRNQITQVRKV
jgi:hypothetical protein